ncbi:MAG: hypothetical protein OZSIB_2749 [Candidatus Ozemobacter sibiricus]|jgi:hypothetical protein|uniref:Transporter n=1 Tax=Candidatus Ozemobacter sibiricus TaxID=2268124 RepID=A0A367ZU52_9BACT|nr:MAG: hypothetical protein OZSIB_2749 [Candidatus Ozemobacter sibiricus]
MAHLDLVSRLLQRGTEWFERLLAVCIFLGVVVFTLHSAWNFLSADWGQTETIYELIYRVLLAVIALELIRTLVTHELQSVLELLAFVVARKTLKPDLSVYDIFLSVVAFAILLGGRRYLFLPPAIPHDEEASRGSGQAG